jgi:hypothetical protein
MRHWFQFSIIDMLVTTAVAAGFTTLNFIEYDIGSGLSIVQKGWPLPFVTNHSLDGTAWQWTGLAINVFFGLFISGLAMMMSSRVRRRRHREISSDKICG